MMHVFHHFPKTGGGYFQDIISMSCPDVNLIKGVAQTSGKEFLFKDFYLNKKIPTSTVLTGHFSYGLLELFGLKPKYCTVLRNPIDRIISEYFYSRSQVSDQKLFVPKNDIYDSFIRFVQQAKHLNLYSRILSGQCAYLGNYLHLESDIYEEGEPESEFQQARENLATQFDVVGIFDMFESTMLSLVNFYGGDTVNFYKTRKHVTINKPKLTELPFDTISLLEEKTKYDMDLYKEYKIIFSKNLPAENNLAINSIDLSIKHYFDWNTTNRVNRLIAKWHRLSSKIIIFGAGEHTHQLLETFSFNKVNVIAIIDSNNQKNGSILKAFTVSSLTELSKYSFDEILISSKEFQKEMAAVLLKKDINTDKICHIY